MNNETILKLAQECDGWSILDPEKLIAMGAGRGSQATELKIAISQALAANA